MSPTNSIAEKVIEPVTRKRVVEVLDGLRGADRQNLGSQQRTRIEHLIMAYRKCGPAWCLVVDDHAICLGGVGVLWRGVAEAYLFTTPLIERYRWFAVSAIATLLEEATLSQGLHRIQIAVRATDERATKFAKWLGFDYEGPLRRYGIDGADFARYAWLR